MLRIDKKKVIIFIIIVVIAVILFFYLRGCTKSIGLVYRYENAEIGEVKKTISVAGRLEVQNSYQVLSKINGIVKKVHVDFNQNVKKGQLLAELDTSEINQKITKVEAEMERAALDLLAAKRDLDGKKDLLKENLISKRGLEQAELNYKKISSQLKQIQIDHKMVLKTKSYANIKSPSNGIVISKEIDTNTPVNQNKVMFIIAEDLKKMRLIIQVDESDIGYIKKGQNVSFTVSAFPEKVFIGKVSQVRINPITKAQGQIVSYQSIVSCDNEELILKPGMTATATVVVKRKENVLRVHNEAFIVSPVEIENPPEKKFVWVKRRIALDGLPVEREEVETGIVGDYYTEIISGSIDEGDQILVGIHKELETKEDLH